MITNPLRGVSLCLLASALAAGCVVGDTAGPNDPTSSDPTAASPVDIAARVLTRDHIAFNFFVGKGLTKAQSAGIVGNLLQESGVNPGAVQYGGGPGRGIAQWSVGGRWDRSYHANVTWYAAAHHLSRWSLTAQLDFIWWELTHEGYGYSALRHATNVTAATIVFQDKYEICGACDSSRRIADAKHVLAKYGGTASHRVIDAAPCDALTPDGEIIDEACLESTLEDAPLEDAPEEVNP